MCSIQIFDRKKTKKRDQIPFAKSIFSPSRSPLRTHRQQQRAPLHRLQLAALRREESWESAQKPSPGSPQTSRQLLGKLWERGETPPLILALPPCPPLPPSNGGAHPRDFFFFVRPQRRACLGRGSRELAPLPSLKPWREGGGAPISAPV